MLQFLADNNFGDTRSGDGLAGPMALLLILLLGAATVFLIRNMNKRIKRLPETFDSASMGGGVRPDTPTSPDAR
ncbi:hypothetical protein [Catellatospora tritici]|uniref:hypothetical protein n=1 Tax=Catellatospora tritici TaxID=2851566 RepID=UPI001C2CF6BE|nr:hypothetical protein [Catellatospora tritici]